MSIALNSSVIANGILTVDATVTPPAGYKLKSFFITCGGDYAYYLIPRRYYYATSNDYQEPIQTITTASRSLSRIPLAQWPNGALDFIVSAKYQNTANSTIITETAPVTVSIANTAYQAPQAPDPIVQPEGQLAGPVITVFGIPANSPTHSIAVTLLAKDNNAVAGYFISESPVLPSTPLWQASPATYSPQGYGTVTLYAWAKDAEGNISDRVSAIGTVPPPPPSASPKGGKFQTGQTVSFINVNGRTVIYTLDGSDPRHYIPVNELTGKAAFNENTGLLVLTDEPYAP